MNNIRTIRYQATAEDFSHAEFQNLVERRTAQNNRLLEFIYGDRRAVPLYDVIPLPGTKIEQPETAEKWLAEMLNHVSEQVHGQDAQRRFELRDKGVLVPDGRPVNTSVEKAVASIADLLPKVLEITTAGNCLWHAGVFQQVVARVKFLRDYGYTNADFIPGNDGNADQQPAEI